MKPGYRTWSKSLSQIFTEVAIEHACTDPETNTDQLIRETLRMALEDIESAQDRLKEARELVDA